MHPQATITVCIPAYRSHRFIEYTLQSVRRQTYRDIRVEIALEKTADHERTIEVCAKFLSDSRFHLSINDGVLGWAANVEQLLRKVETEYFVILPHDDIWHVGFLEKLCSTLQRQSDAVVAYADMVLFGERTDYKFIDLPRSDPVARLSSLYLHWDSTLLWRGLTRSSVLHGGQSFPNNEFIGFGVDVEWEQFLLQQGEAARIPLPLYFKRMQNATSMTVTGRWARAFSVDKIRAVLSHHDEHLHNGLGVLSPTALQQIGFARQVSLLKRFLGRTRQRIPLDSEQLAAIDQLRAELNTAEFALKGPVLSRLDIVLARNALICREFALAKSHLEIAAAHDPLNWEAPFYSAKLHLKQGQAEKALGLASEASALVQGHFSAPVHHLVLLCKKKLAASVVEQKQD